MYVGFFGDMVVFRLLMCEFLDNKCWVDIVGMWYLKLFLEVFMDMVKVVLGWEWVLLVEVFVCGY